MADNWFNSFAKIKAFGKVLHKAGLIEDNAKDVFAYFDSPTTYNEAYEVWEELGSPQPNEDGWDEFKDSVEVVVEDE